MGGICSTPISVDEKLLTAPYFNSKWIYKGVAFENGSGDICLVEVDAIVNASNGQLVHNNGLSNSIIAQGGEVIQDESNRIIEDNNGACYISVKFIALIILVNVGTAVSTSGGTLTAQHIIHVVTPIWTGGDNERLIRADQLGVKSIAFPSLTSGVFGFPKEICAEIIINKCVDYLEEHISMTSLKSIKFVNLDTSTVRIFKIQLEKVISSRIIAEGGDPSKVFLTENDQSTINRVQNQRMITLESQQTHGDRNEMRLTTNTYPLLTEEKSRNQRI